MSETPVFKLPRIVCLTCPAVMRVDHVETEYREDSLLLVLFCHGTHLAAKVDMLFAADGEGQTVTSDQLRLMPLTAIEERIGETEKAIDKLSARLVMLQRVVKSARL